AGAHTLDELVAAFNDAIEQVEALKRAHKIKDGTWLNACVTDGKSVVGVRYLSPHEAGEPLTLYVSQGSRSVCEGDVCRMGKADTSEHAVLVVSEKLTNLRQDWKKVPANHFVTVNEAGDVGFRPVVPKKARARARA